MESYIPLTVQLFEHYVDCVARADKNGLAAWLAPDSGVSAAEPSVPSDCQQLLHRPHHHHHHQPETAPPQPQLLAECLHVLFSHRLRRPHAGYWPLLRELSDRVTLAHTLAHATSDVQRGRYWLLLAARHGTRLEFLVASLAAHRPLLQRHYLPTAFVYSASLLQRTVAAASLLAATLRSHSTDTGDAAAAARVATAPAPLLARHWSRALVSTDDNNSVFCDDNGSSTLSPSSDSGVLSPPPPPPPAASSPPHRSTIATTNVTATAGDDNSSSGGGGGGSGGGGGPVNPITPSATSTCPRPQPPLSAAFNGDADNSGRDSDRQHLPPSMLHQQQLQQHHHHHQQHHQEQHQQQYQHQHQQQQNQQQHHQQQQQQQQLVLRRPRRRLAAGLGAPPSVRASWHCATAATQTGAGGTSSSTAAASSASAAALAALSALGQRGVPEGSEDPSPPPAALSRHNSSLLLDKMSHTPPASTTATASAIITSTARKAGDNRQLKRKLTICGGVAFRPAIVPALTSPPLRQHFTDQTQDQHTVYEQLVSGDTSCPTTLQIVPEHQMAGLTDSEQCYLRQSVSTLLLPGEVVSKLCFSVMFRSHKCRLCLDRCLLLVTSQRVVLCSCARADSVLNSDTQQKCTCRRVWPLSDIATILLDVCGHSVCWRTKSEVAVSNRLDSDLWQLYVADTAAAAQLVSQLLVAAAAVAGRSVLSADVAGVVVCQFNSPMLSTIAEMAEDIVYSSLVYMSDREYIDTSAQLYSYLFYRTCSADHWMPAHCLLWRDELQLYWPSGSDDDQCWGLTTGGGSARPPDITWPLVDSSVCDWRCQCRQHPPPPAHQLQLHVPSGSRQLQLLLADSAAVDRWMVALTQLKTSRQWARPIANPHMSGGVEQRERLTLRQLLLSRRSLHVIAQCAGPCRGHQVPSSTPEPPTVTAPEHPVTVSTALCAIGHVFVHSASASLVLELSSFDPLVSSGTWTLFFATSGEMTRFANCLRQQQQQLAAAAAATTTLETADSYPVFTPLTSCVPSLESAAAAAGRQWQPFSQ